MKWTKHYREDRGITEWICEHGCGHPDLNSLPPGDDGTHGCDGCCNRPDFPGRLRKTSCRSPISDKLINYKATKRFILAQCAARRPYWNCTRVSGGALANIEAGLRATIISLIEGHPTRGQTFNP